MRLPKNVIIPFEDLEADMEDEEEVASEVGDILSGSMAFVTMALIWALTMINKRCMFLT